MDKSKAALIDRAQDIVAALQCCSRTDAHNTGCDDCPYEYCGPQCDGLCKSAGQCITDLIDQLAALQSENSELKQRLDNVNDFEKSQCAKLLEKLSRVEAERDAARRDCAVAEENHHKTVIERDAAMRVADERYRASKQFGTARGLSNAMGLVVDSPTIDPIRAAGGCRCGECKYWDDDGRCAPPENGLIREYTKPTDFCSYGEAREAQDDG